MSDVELWDELREGSRKALRKIYDSHFHYLYNYGRKIFQDTGLVEDSIQDLFVEIWQRHDRLGKTDSIRRYLAASLRRKIVATLKKMQKTQQVEGFEQIGFAAELAIEDILIAREMTEEQALRLKRAFDALSGRQKEVLYLRFYEGLEYEQIAEIVGIRYQSLRNLISGGIKRLRSELMAGIVWLWLMN